MLTLCSHLVELDRNADVLRIRSLSVADVVSMIRGTEIGLMHAFKHWH